MKNFIKWLVPWDKEMKWLLIVLGVCFLLIIIFASGCSDNSRYPIGDITYDIDSQLICSPADADLCKGWKTEE
jgi:hypothetical protein